MYQIRNCQQLVGVKKRIKQLKEGINKEFGKGENEEVDEELTEEIYSLFGDDAYGYLKGKFPKDSDLAYEILEAREKKESLSQFEQRFKSVIDFENDSFIRDKIRELYESEVK